MALAIYYLIRPLNLLIIVLTQCLSYYCIINPSARSGSLLPLDLLLIVFSTVLVAAAGYIINDYYDVKIDLINKPEKVIIGKYITRRKALLFNFFFNFLAIGVGFMVGIKVGIVNTMAVFLLWAYSNYLKRKVLLGNLVIALLTALVIFVTALFYQAFSLYVYIYASFAFLSTLIREIIKDMEDVKGDQRYGCITLPIWVGIRKTKVFLFFISLLFITFITVSFQYLSLNTVLNVSFFLIFPVLIFLYFLIKADKKKDFAWLSKLVKVYMLIGVISMLLI